MLLKDLHGSATHQQINKQHQTALCDKPNNHTVLVAGFGLSTVSWLVFAMTFAFDLSRYSLERTWLWRFPLVLIAAGQVAQLRYCFLSLNNLPFQLPAAIHPMEEGSSLCVCDVAMLHSLCSQDVQQSPCPALTFEVALQQCE